MNLATDALQGFDFQPFRHIFTSFIGSYTLRLSVDDQRGRRQNHRLYHELDVEVEMEYFEGGFALKYKTCPYYKLVKTGQKTRLCNLRKRVLDCTISRVSHGKEGKMKIIKSLLKNEHPCVYAIFLTGFLEED